MRYIANIFKHRKESIILFLMLELLHFSIWLDFGSPLSRSMLLVHLGLFLIWQPVWKGDEKLAWYNGILFIFLTLFFVVWMNFWFLSVWLILLTGISGGRVVIDQQDKYSYMLVLFFLVSELLIACTTSLFNVETPQGVKELFSIILPLLPFILLIPPYGKAVSTKPSVDIVHAAITVLLISLLIVGSLLTMYHSATDYISALVQTLLAIGLLLITIGWLLSPRAGFSGLSQLWFKSVLNIGTPFEQWLIEIDNLFEREESPEEFIEAAISELVSLPWISGASWKTGISEGQAGQESRHQTNITSGDITITLYSYRSIGGALYLHCKLLVQIINNFYVAKLRERKLTQQTHLQAIHETGARVTHDIKNLLQSLHAITSVIIHETDPSSNAPSQALLKKQLPILTQRLQLALDKLQTPKTSGQNDVYLKDWWHDVQRRNSLVNTKFHADITGDPIVSADLFDSVVDNLLENLRGKAQLESDLEISITIFSDSDHIYLTICDNGKKIPDHIAKSILLEPIQSDNGLGIGLYQAAQQAEGLGYKLLLKDNNDGKVCFELYNTHESG